MHDLRNTQAKAALLLLVAVMVCAKAPGHLIQNMELLSNALA